MKPTDYREVAATSYPTNGSSALTPSFSAIQRNRGNRFEMDLSTATVIGCLQAYEARMQKSNPRYSAGPAIAILRDIEEAERINAETSLDENGQPMEWAGPFMPLDICADFWILFERFIVNVPGQNGRKRHSSTAKGYADKIVAALHWASAYGAKLDKSFRDFNFSRYAKKKITPSADQISLIYHYDLDVAENRKKIKALAEEMNVWGYSLCKMKRIRDHFVLSCSLGQRISDSKRFDPSNFSGDVFETTQQKTGNKAKVDLKDCAIDYDVVKEILDRYGWKAPAYGLDTSFYNKMLHLLCRAIGGPFDRIISWEYKECGSIRQESAPIWQLITSHVARRTFITNEIRKGKNIVEVTRESGHSDARHLNEYYAPDHY